MTLGCDSSTRCRPEFHLVIHHALENELVGKPITLEQVHRGSASESQTGPTFTTHIVDDENLHSWVIIQRWQQLGSEKEVSMDVQALCQANARNEQREEEKPAHCPTSSVHVVATS